MDLPKAFSWGAMCYRLEDEIFVSFRDEMVAIHLDTKELRYCEKEFLQNQKDMTLLETRQNGFQQGVYLIPFVEEKKNQVLSAMHDFLLKNLIFSEMDEKQFAYKWEKWTEDCENCIKFIGERTLMNSEV